MQRSDSFSNPSSSTWPLLIATILFFLLGFARFACAADFEMREGGIIRGPRDSKKIALEFTGHTFAEGGTVILDQLARHKAKASFFLTGDFLGNPKFKPLVERIIMEGHYI